MHPGHYRSNTRVLENGPLKVTLHSVSDDGAWEGQWELFPHYAIYTQLKASKPYWWLYEGTPGGSIEPESDFWLRPDGSTGPLSQGWRGGKQPADWVAFGDPAAQRSLLLVHQRNKSEQSSYWLMQDAMTVFGFGRLGMEKHIDQTPTRFYVSLMETTDFETISAMADSMKAPLQIERSWIE